MRDFFNNLRWKMADIMEGRNGMDPLAIYSMFAGLILTVLNMFIGNIILSLLGLAFLVYSLFRCYSKNVDKRQAECERFQNLIDRPRKHAERTRVQFENRKTTKYFTCSQCGQSLSVPKGKGTLKVTCPKCKAETIIKS